MADNNVFDIRNLHSALKSRIKGRIYVNVREDGGIYVKIDHGDVSFYEILIPENGESREIILSQIRYHRTFVTKIAKTIEDKYTDYLLSHYLYY